MFKIGVTETYDPSIDFSWVNNLKDANIIITKNVNDEFRRSIMENERYKKCVIHVTCTGWGGSLFEPNVPSVYETVNNVSTLINMGFPISQLVLRIDPIIPNTTGLNNARKVLESFNSLGITRVRFSILDLYPHVIIRINNLINDNKDNPIIDDYKLPWSTWSVPTDLLHKVADLLEEFKNDPSYNYEFESCAEPAINKLRPNLITSIGCVSHKDLNILGIEGTLVGPSRQRATCLCPSNKVQIIKRKPGRCPHNCIYCYWKS